MAMHTFIATPKQQYSIQMTFLCNIGSHSLHRIHVTFKIFTWVLIEVTQACVVGEQTVIKHMPQKTYLSFSLLTITLENK